MSRSISVKCPYCGETSILNAGYETPDCTLFGCPACGNYFVAVTKVTVSVSVRKIEGFGGNQDGE